MVSHRSIEPLSFDGDADDNSDDESDDDGEMDSAASSSSSSSFSSSSSSASASSSSSTAFLGRRSRQAEPAAISPALVVGETVFVSAPRATETYQVEITAVDDKAEVGFGTATYRYCDRDIDRRYGEQSAPLGHFTRSQPAKRSRRRSSAFDNGDYEY